jgi:hypothetical protein
MILARVPESRLDRFDQWQFFANGKWSADFNRLSRLCDGMANEYSVSYLPKLNKYIVVYTQNGFSGDIVVRFAARPEGPWSAPENIHVCPELSRGGEVFCYAAKGHPALSPGSGELIVTYVASSFNFEDIAENADLYRPRFLKLRFTN